jgi:hypothetical protein
VPSLLGNSCDGAIHRHVEALVCMHRRSRWADVTDRAAWESDDRGGRGTGRCATAFILSGDVQ